MEMDMQEPGDMCCCGWEEHGPAIMEGELKKISGLHERASHIIISSPSIAYSL